MPRGAGQYLSPSNFSTRGSISVKGAPHQTEEKAANSERTASTLGKVTVFSNNPFAITPGEFNLLYLVESAAKDEQDFVSTKAVIKEGNLSVSTPELSRSLKKLADKGHLEIEKKGALSFKNTRYLNDYFPIKRLVVPGVRGLNKGGKEVHLSVESLRKGKVKLLVGDSANYFKESSIPDPSSFTKAAREVARDALNNKMGSAQVIDLGSTPSRNMKFFLTMFPYKGKGAAKAAVGFKFTRIDQNKSVKIGADISSQELDGLVEAADLLGAAQLIERRRDVERGLLGRDLS